MITPLISFGNISEYLSLEVTSINFILSDTEFQQDPADKLSASTVVTAESPVLKPGCDTLDSQISTKQLFPKPAPAPIESHLDKRRKIFKDEDPNLSGFKLNVGLGGNIWPYPPEQEPTIVSVNLQGTIGGSCYLNFDKVSIEFLYQGILTTSNKLGTIAGITIIEYFTKPYIGLRYAQEWLFNENSRTEIGIAFGWKISAISNLEIVFSRSTVNEPSESPKTIGQAIKKQLRNSKFPLPDLSDTTDNFKKLSKLIDKLSEIDFVSFFAQSSLEKLSKKAYDGMAGIGHGMAGIGYKTFKGMEGIGHIFARQTKYMSKRLLRLIAQLRAQYRDSPLYLVQESTVKQATELKDTIEHTKDYVTDHTKSSIERIKDTIEYAKNYMQSWWNNGKLWFSPQDPETEELANPETEELANPKAEGYELITIEHAKNYMQSWLNNVKLWFSPQDPEPEEAEGYELVPQHPEEYELANPVGYELVPQHPEGYELANPVGYELVPQLMLQDFTTFAKKIGVTFHDEQPIKENDEQPIKEKDTITSQEFHIMQEEIFRRCRWLMQDITTVISDLPTTDQVIETAIEEIPGIIKELNKDISGFDVTMYKISFTLKTTL